MSLETTGLGCRRVFASRVSFSLLLACERAGAYSFPQYCRRQLEGVSGPHGHHCLLLALGMEHAATAWGEHQEARHLRIDLHDENERNLSRGRALIRIETVLVKGQMLAEQAALTGGNSPYEDLPPADAAAQDVSDPVWRAALTSTHVRLLSRDEIAILGEVDSLIHADDAADSAVPRFELLLHQPQYDAARKQMRFGAMTPADRLEWAQCMHEDIVHRERHIANLQTLVGALQALHAGVKQYDAVIAAENKTS